MKKLQAELAEAGIPALQQSVRLRKADTSKHLAFEGSLLQDLTWA